MRSASVLVVIVLAAGCTTSAPGEGDGPAEGLVVVAQEHTAGFQTGTSGDAGERARDEAPPTLAPDREPPPGEPPPAQSSASPPPTPYYGVGSGDSTSVPFDDSPRPQRLRFALGPDAQPGPYVASVTLGDDASSFSAALRVVPEATTRIDALVALENPTASTFSVVLRGPFVQDARVQGARLLAAGHSVDLLVPDPRISFTLAPGARIDVGLEVTVGTTPSGDTLPTWSVQMDVSGS